MFTSSILGVLGLFLAFHLRRIWIILVTLPRDLQLLWRMIKLSLTMKSFKRENTHFLTLFSKVVARKPYDACLIFKNRKWTFKEVEDYSWKIARVFKKRGFVKGDVVALVCTNRPEYVMTWLGLARLGVVTSLVNTNLRHEALKHSLNVCNPRAVIVSIDLIHAVLEIRESLPKDCILLRFCGEDQEEDEKSVHEFDSLNRELNEESPIPIPNLPLPKYRDPIMYIYTSGTTGLPKAAVITNSRFIYVVYVSYFILGLRKDDRWYVSVPLYHTAGGLLGIATTLCEGLSTVVRDKFSASAYFKDCAENKCTIGLYIGEICRYLLATPPGDYDQKHNLRIMTGNGLRPAIWKQFVQRFNIPIYELYGSTEGNSNIANIDGTVGAVGCLPNFLPASLIPMALVKVNPDTLEIIRRSDNNFAIRCKPGESGMLIGLIDDGDPTREFKGYVDKVESNKKIAHDLFRKGDKYFITGDILELDEKQYLYFKDRTGDTFRWKGENVSTAEVESAVSKAAGLRDVCVYGVQVPNTEGRAGMAAILDPDGTLDLMTLAHDLEKLLPPYAQPLFLRIAYKIELTGTYKLKKVELQKEGYDIDKVTDKLFLKQGKEFVEFTRELHQDLLNGRIRV